MTGMETLARLVCRCGGLGQFEFRRDDRGRRWSIQKGSCGYCFFFEAAIFL